MPPSREPTSRGSLLGRHPRVLGAVVLLAALAVAVGALGGWARTTPDGVRVVAPGVEVEVSPMVVRLDRAVATYEVSGHPAEPGRAYVVVEGSLAVDHNEPVAVGIVSDALLADLRSTYSPFGRASDQAEPTVQVAEDGSTLVGMGPGLTYQVLLVYEIDEGAVPSGMTMVLREHTRRRSFIDGTVGWWDPEPFAEVTLPIAPLPDERPPEEDHL